MERIGFFCYNFLSMQEETLPLSFSILESIEEIPRQEWGRLFDKTIIEGYGFHQTLEQSNLKEFTIRYLLGKRDNSPVLIIPFFVMDFSFDMLISGPLNGLVKKLKSIFTLKIIFLGAPTAEEFYMGITQEEKFRVHPRRSNRKN